MRLQYKRTISKNLTTKDVMVEFTNIIEKLKIDTGKWHKSVWVSYASNNATLNRYVSFRQKYDGLVNNEV